MYKYNFKSDLSNYSNPQRSTYALGKEGGLLLCNWPKGGQLSLPFVYSNEVWTGIEYQVASHLIMEGQVKEGLDIVRATRKRYDGSTRNPYEEYECGHFYMRAMSNYALLQAMTGLRYDAVTGTLFVDSKIGDFTCFLSTNTGFGTVTLKQGKINIDVAYGKIDLREHSKQILTDFALQMKTLPEVQVCLHLSGEFDFLLHITVRDPQAFKCFQLEKLLLIPAIDRVQS